MGPSELFHFPDSIWIMAAGQIFHGLVDPFLLVPVLPEMINSVVNNKRGQEERINDLSAGVFNCFLGMGQICGPLYGSYMAT